MGGKREKCEAFSHSPFAKGHSLNSPQESLSVYLSRAYGFILDGLKDYQGSCSSLLAPSLRDFCLSPCWRTASPPSGRGQT
jgi:hypothetical protein